MTTVVITSSQYDLLMQTNPDWMTQNWKKLYRRWFSGGVSCQVPRELEAELARVCASVGFNPGLRTNS